MTVTLISHTAHPEMLIAAAAKLCYSESGCEDIMEGLDDDKTQRFVKMLASIGHESPIEHVSFTFAIEGVSRTLLAQITRHRHASFSVQSQRYVKQTNFEYITPPSIENDSHASKIFKQAMDSSIGSYNKLTDILQEKYYNEFISQGLNDKTARSKSEKKAIEDARFVLPNACETKMVVTMNARSLYNFFKLRCCNRAQWEIRELACKMFELCYKAAPTLFENAGPSCVNGVCLEGKMSCGKAEEVRNKFEQLKRSVTHE